MNNYILIEVNQEKYEFLNINGSTVKVPKGTITAALCNNKNEPFTEWVIEGVVKKKKPVVMTRIKDRKRIKVYVDVIYQHEDYKIPVYVIYKYEDL